MLMEKAPGFLIGVELAEPGYLFPANEFKLADTPAVARRDFAMKFLLEVFICTV